MRLTPHAAAATVDEIVLKVQNGVEATSFVEAQNAITRLVYAATTSSVSVSYLSHTLTTAATFQNMASTAVSRCQR